MGEGKTKLGENQKLHSQHILMLLAEDMKRSISDVHHMLYAGADTQLLTYETEIILQAIDAVLLYNRLAANQTELNLEPVHVGSVMYDVAHDLQAVMRQQACTLDIDVQTNLKPVDVDKRVLKSALTGLWQSFVLSVTKPTTMRCKAFKTKSGQIRVSLQASSDHIERIRPAAANINSMQPLASIAGPASSYLTAEVLFSLLNAVVRPKTIGDQFALGVSLSPSQQLELLSTI